MRKIKHAKIESVVSPKKKVNKLIQDNHLELSEKVLRESTTATTGTLQRSDDTCKAEVPSAPTLKLGHGVSVGPQADEEQQHLTYKAETQGSGSVGQLDFMGLLNLAKCSSVSGNEPDSKSYKQVVKKEVDGDASGGVKDSSHLATSKNFLADFESLVEDSEPELEPEQIEADEDTRPQKFKSHSFAETLRPFAQLVDKRPRRQSALDKPHGLLLSDDQSSRKSSKGSPLKCKFCAKIFFIEKRLLNHIRSKHQNPSDTIGCKECPFQAAGKVLAVQHRQLVHGAPTVVIKSSENLGHLYNLIQAGANSCDELLRNVAELKSKDLTSNPATSDLIHSAADDPQHRCHECQAVLKTKFSLKSHLARAHSTVKIKCKFCVNQFKYIYSYKRHLQQIQSIFDKNILAESIAEIRGEI